MNRPEIFRHSYVAIRNLPYFRAEDGSWQTHSEEGVFGRGQVVWTKQTYPSRPRPKSDVAFVDGIGAVRIDPRWLEMVDDAKTKH